VEAEPKASRRHNSSVRNIVYALGGVHSHAVATTAFPWQQRGAGAAHLAVAGWFAAGLLLHTALQGSFDAWARNPRTYSPTLYVFWDPHAFAAAGAQEPSYSGLYNRLAAAGFTGQSPVLAAALGLGLCASGCTLPLAGSALASRLLRAGSLIAPLGLLSLAWAGHLAAASLYPALHSLARLRLGFGPALTALGGLDAYSSSLLRSDMIHHHLGVGLAGLWLGPPLARCGHAVRALPPALAALAAASPLLAHHSLSMPAFPWLRLDVHAAGFLFAHHSWLGSAFTLGFFAHVSIWLAGRSPSRSLAALPRLAAPAHLSYVSLFLGFHLFLLFLHNDSVSALSSSASPPAQLLCRPVFAERAPSPAEWGRGRDAAQEASQAFFRHLGPGDFFAHHAIALGLHATALVLVSGSASARGSRLFPDKAAHGFGFACDGPGRGGSCDISGWDAVYLAGFWLLNTEAWALFYLHWALLGQAATFPAGAPTLLAWFRDYLWFSSAAVIRGYTALGVNEVAAASWAFLLFHLAWATGFMFLVSWRGYWQELVEIVAYFHLGAPALSAGVWRAAPAALSILQARCVGLAHFCAGFIGTYFCFFGSFSAQLASHTLASPGRLWLPHAAFPLPAREPSGEREGGSLACPPARQPACGPASRLLAREGPAGTAR
jgi:photosystem I P700 chlorophyll a apoprotein A2